MVSTSGAQLLPQDAIKELRIRLFPFTTVLTPNIAEANLLLADAGKEVKEIECIDDLIRITKHVQALGPEYVLVKGGHFPFKGDGTVASEEAERKLVVNILYGHGKTLRIDSVYQHSRNTHGTGCSLACE